MGSGGRCSSAVAAGHLLLLLLSQAAPLERCALIISYTSPFVSYRRSGARRHKGKGEGEDRREDGADGAGGRQGARAARCGGPDEQHGGQRGRTKEEGRGAQEGGAEARPPVLQVRVRLPEGRGALTRSHAHLLTEN